MQNYLFMNKTNSTNWQITHGTINIPNANIILQLPILVELMINENRTYKVNNNTGNLSGNTSSIINTNPLRLSFNGKIKYYYFKVYKNNEIKCDLISVVDKHNIPCMYDKVSNKLFYNTNNNEFIAGPKITSSGGGSINL